MTSKDADELVGKQTNCQHSFGTARGKQMQYVDSIAAFIGVYIISVASPGPNFIIVTSTSMTVSRAAGLFAGLGIAIASLSWAVMAMAGLGLLVAHFEWLRVTLQVFGALYLIWLGVKMVRDAAKPARGPTRTGEVTWHSSMRQAFFVSMTNPKSLAFFGSIFVLVIPQHAPIWFYSLIGVICFSMSCIWHCGLALFFSNPKISSYFVRQKKTIDRVMGTALILLGGRLLWSR